MSGNKRQKQIARAKYERQQERRAGRAARQKRTQQIIAVVVVVALVFGGVAWFVLSHQASDTAPVAGASPSASSSPTASATANVEAAVLDCRAPGTARPNDITFDKPDATTTATELTLSTNCGDIVIALNPKAPTTIASEAFLAGKGFYDATSCHRLTTSGIFVLQCGDPAGNGTGGPGYSIPDENLPADGAANYPAGTVAMANAGPGTGGSQFFLVYDDTTLPGDYTVWGTVTSGLDIVKEVASVGTQDGGADGSPRQPVFIESATVQ